MKNEICIGCSGYYYPNWKNHFYPKGLPPKNWLEYYGSVFNTVELNGTFYRIPTRQNLEKYASVTPRHFTFSVKMNKTITHVHQLTKTAKIIEEFQQLIREGLAEKQSHFLFQLPPSFHYSEENLGRILENIPHHPENVVELRHHSWWNKDVETAFKKASLTFCNVDFPGLETFFMHTTDYFYLRLHGNPELFKSAYSTEKLLWFKEEFPTATARNSIYFNNTYYEAAYTNAQELAKLMTRPATVQEHISKNTSR